jgi:hypothetical protein
VTSRIAVSLFVVFYFAASIRVSNERVLLWTDWIHHAIGAQNIKFEAPKTSAILGFPRFSHAKKINRAFEFDLPRSVSAPQLVVLGFPVELHPAHVARVIVETTAARSPPAV